MKVLGPGLIASSCVLACSVGASLAGWAIVMLLAFGGGRLCIASAGCNPSTGESPPVTPDGSSRRRRAAIGLVALVVAAGAAALAARGWLEAVPVAALAAWFGTSFVVAAATGYAGCPELGAIASLFRREPLATTCPPLATKPPAGRSGNCGC